MSILTRNKIQTTVVRNKHIGWSLSARHTGTQGPCDGFLGNLFEQAIVVSYI